MGGRFISTSKKIEEKGKSGLEEERRLAYVAITRAKSLQKYHFQWIDLSRRLIDSMASRFVDELPDEYIKNNNFIDEKEEDFEFNQDIDFDSDTEIRSPGGAPLPKKLKWVW